MYDFFFLHTSANILVTIWRNCDVKKKKCSCIITQVPLGTS